MPALHHIALGANDVMRLAQFYQNLFGLQALNTHRKENGDIRAIWLDLAPGILMIEKSECDSANLAPMALGQGPFLLAFTLDEKEETQFLTNLHEQQISLEGRTAATLYFRDIENNRVAVSWY